MIAEVGTRLRSCKDSAAMLLVRKVVRSALTCDRKSLAELSLVLCDDLEELDGGGGQWVGGRLKGEKIYENTYSWCMLLLQQRLTQHCKAIILWLKKKKAIADSKKKGIIYDLRGCCKQSWDRWKHSCFSSFAETVPHHSSLGTNCIFLVTGHSRHAALGLYIGKW